MAQRRFPYEQAFEHYLRANRIPYVAVDEAKKALLPATAKKKAAQSIDAVASLKSFDFVVYAPQGNLLIDVKGRMFGSAKSHVSTSNRRYESWVTQDDVDSLTRWQELFGRDFTAVFVFAYCLRQQPPDALFDELFAFGNKWYALREAKLSDYMLEMKPRSGKWQTVHVPGEAFSRISRPFLARQPAQVETAEPALFQ
jgi:hypothetical protein